MHFVPVNFVQVTSARGPLVTVVRSCHFSGIKHPLRHSMNNDCNSLFLVFKDNLSTNFKDLNVVDTFF